MKTGDSTCSKIATTAVAVVVGVTIASVVLSTANYISENRGLMAAKFQNYGKPIEVEAIDRLGCPTKIILTSSTIESSPDAMWSQ